MKPNSCVFTAVNKLTNYQFGKSADADKFEELNNGEGIRLEDLPKVVDNILPVNVEINNIYVCGEVNFTGGYGYRNVRGEVVSSPCMVIVEDNHAEALLSGSRNDVSVAITLRRK